MRKAINSKLRPVLLGALLLICYSVGLTQDARLIAKTIFPSVVMLEMRDEANRPLKLGSGFFVRPDVIATNYHVIAGASGGFAKIVGKPSTYRIEGVVGIDKTRDLALLKLTGVAAKPLILGDVGSIEAGQEVFALGNPKGLEGTISTGIVSGSSLRSVENEFLLQITAPISPGSSGGPVVDRKGHVIGVAVASLKDGQNLNFAIPAPYLALLLANSKNTVSLSEANRTSNQESVSPGPTLSETSKWIVETLSAKGGLDHKGYFVVRNERIAFDGCSMILTLSHTKGVDFQNYETSIAPLNKLAFVYEPVDKRMVGVSFSDDAVRVKEETNSSGEKTTNTFRMDFLLIWAGNDEMVVRVGKAFARLKELCRDETTKEPF